MKPALCRVATVATIAAIAAGCKSKAHPSSEAVGPSSARPSTSAVARAQNASRFIDDDMPRALERARREHKAVFVDTWAAWCHSCTSMRGFVLGDPALDRYSGRVVFAAVDTDREQNAEFLRRYAVTVWPSFFVLDADSGKIAGYWTGSASLRELLGFIDQGLDTLQRSRAGGLDPASPSARLIAAKASDVAHDWAAAARGYAEAEAGFDRGSAEWSEAVHGRLRAIAALGSVDECIDLGVADLDYVVGAARPADFAGELMACAQHSHDPTRKRRAASTVAVRMRKYVDAPPAGAAADDRSEALDVLSEALVALGQRDAARAALVERLSVVEHAAAAAPDPASAQAYDAARASSLVDLGRGEDALVLLTERERELPDAYDPPARVSDVLVRLGRKTEAVAALERAVARAYGPRRVEYLDREANLRHELGDRPGEVATLEMLVTAADALPAPIHDEERVSAARARLETARKALRP